LIYVSYVHHRKRLEFP